MTGGFISTIEIYLGRPITSSSKSEIAGQTSCGNPVIAGGCLVKNS
ncbi:hypothetical protein LDVICp173 [lymphocystis disease virus-China]|uniref:Uncharacterized protein n=1 Tax=lymphocystis disease virus-China TaxID=256729 RepID=Q677U0_9VIRU|nr:hypothetical protein LDVICp173 [lymphocystis disease virus-China]AAU11017.1 hypothetical protein [lymphocystis disease virus-China]